MHDLKLKAIEGYSKNIASLEQLRDVVDLIPDGLVELPGAYMYSSTYPNLRIDLAYTPTAFRDARQILGDDWKRQGNEWQCEDGDRVFSLVHIATEVRLQLVLRADDKFATCQRRQTGSKEVPIYEVICQEMA